MFKFLKTLIFLLFIFILPDSVSAATLYFEPAVGSVGPGSTMAVDILIDVEDCANVVEADISFPNDYMQLRDFIVGESVLALWVNRPSEADLVEANKTGILNFSGGVPGGYCGKIPGDIGDSNKIARLIFSVPSLIVAEEEKSKLDLIFLSTTRVLLNDGLGTQDALTTKAASYSYSDTPLELNDDWSKEINEDTIPPEPFIVELRKMAGIFDGQYYIIFNTVDKQSGMDHYEVLEIRPDEEIGVVRDLNFWEKITGKTYLAPSWKEAKMPYLLEDQELYSVIRVKAIDKAGNERFVEYIPPESRYKKTISNNKGGWMIFLGFSILAIILLVLVVIFIRKIILNKKYDKE